MHVFLTVALAASLVLAAGLAPPASAAPPDFFGINAQFLRSRQPIVPVEAWPAHLAEMRRLGITVARTDSQWQSVEPSPPSGGRRSYDWTRLDRLVGELARHRLRWWPIVDYSAPWAGILPTYRSAPSPDHYGDYAAFTAALAERYGRGGDFWREHPEVPALPVAQYEIWNEPSGVYHWRPAPDPEAYADLYLEARAALKRVDPEATAVVGGLQFGSGPQFLREMVAARPEIAREADAIGIHPYAADLTGVLAAVRAFRATVDQEFPERPPMAITEVGWPTAGAKPVPDARRAAWLRDLAEVLPESDCGVDWLMPHTWATREEQPDNRQDWFGIYHRDGTQTAAGRGYGQGIAAARAGGERTRRVCTGPTGLLAATAHVVAGAERAAAP